MKVFDAIIDYNRFINIYLLEENKSNFLLKLTSMLIDCLLFYVPLKNISLIWRCHHYGEGLQNLGICSALRAFEQGGIFIVPHLL